MLLFLLGCLKYVQRGFDATLQNICLSNENFYFSNHKYFQGIDYVINNANFQWSNLLCNKLSFHFCIKQTKIQWKFAASEKYKFLRNKFVLNYFIINENISGKNNLSARKTRVVSSNWTMSRKKKWWRGIKLWWMKTKVVH